MSNQEVVRRDVTGCSGCGADHPGMEFKQLPLNRTKRLRVPGQGIVWSRWMGRCPTTRKKVYLIPEGARHEFRKA